MFFRVQLFDILRYSLPLEKKIPNNIIIIINPNNTKKGRERDREESSYWPYSTLYCMSKKSLQLIIFSKDAECPMDTQYLK